MRTRIETDSEYFDIHLNHDRSLDLKVIDRSYIPELEQGEVRELAEILLKYANGGFEMETSA